MHYRNDLEDVMNRTFHPVEVVLLVQEYHRQHKTLAITSPTKWGDVEIHQLININKKAVLYCMSIQGVHYTLYVYDTNPDRYHEYSDTMAEIVYKKHRKYFNVV